jgi:hypothetical protein
VNQQRVEAGPAPVVGLRDQVVYAPNGLDEPVLVLGEPRNASDDIRHVVGTCQGQLLEKLIHASGLASSAFGAAQMASGRWVQLTQESAARLAAASQPALDAQGVPMAVIRESNGQIGHVMRFESLGAAPVAAASLLNGMAVQLALLRIERALEDISERVDLLVEASQIELEADLAAAMSVLRRVERRANHRGMVDDDDWASLAAIEAPIKAAYHQTVRWLDPLRAFVDDEQSLVEQVRTLRANLGARDVEFWLKMYAHGELAMKRWEALYLLRHATVASDRLAHEADLILRHARERHDDLRALHDAIVAYLDAEPTRVGRLDAFRLISRSRLRRLRVELAAAVNAYGAALDQAEVDVPDYAVDALERRQGRLVDIDAMQNAVVGTTRAAIGAGTDAAFDVGRWLGSTTTSAWQRARPAVDTEISGGDDTDMA